MKLVHSVFYNRTFLHPFPVYIGTEITMAAPVMVGVGTGITSWKRSHSVGCLGRAIGVCIFIWERCHIEIAIAKVSRE
jgi:hypothetical protein